MKGRLENDLKTKAYIEKMLVGAPQIMQDYSLSFTNKTESTRQQYIRAVLTYLSYLKENGKDINDVTIFSSIKKVDITRYMEHIRYRYKNGEKIEKKASSRALELYAIAHFFDYLIDEEYLESNPCDRVEKPSTSEEKEVVTLTPEEIELMCGEWTMVTGAWPARDRAILVLALATGLRVTSISEINMEDIDFDDRSIVVTEKGNKTRTCYFGKNTAEVLQRWIEIRNMHLKGKQVDALFISLADNRLSSAAICNVVKRAASGINKHITPHKLRSTFATGLYEKTGDIYLVQEAIGHKNIKNTRRYAKVSEAKRRSAAELMD